MTTRCITVGAGLVAMAFASLELKAEVNLTALKDGKVDAAPVIQAAVDAGSGAIHLERGDYRLSKSIVVDLAKTGFTSFSGAGVARLIMEGSGPAIQFIGTHAGSADPGTFKPEVWQKERMPLVDGIEIIGKHPEADGIAADGTMQLTVTRTTVRDCRHGIHLINRNRNVAISDCHLYQNSGIGVFYDNVNLHQSNISGCHISYCRGGGVVSHAGNVRNLHIGTCDIESNMAADSPPTANVWLDSTGGSIGEVAITGCTIQHSSKAPGCANIRVNGAGDDASLERREGRRTTREGNISITGNVFSDVQINVHLTDARGVTVTGNTFWEGFEHDLLVERCNQVVVGHNNFDRNPRYLVNGFDNAERNGLVFRDSADCMISSNVINGVWKKAAALHLKGCDRFNVAGNSILDSDGVGLLLEQTRNTLVADNIIRDDRPSEKRSAEPSLKLIGNDGNVIGSNVLGNGRKVE